MTDKAANSKRIARNTIFLYIRMIVVMGVSLYTSRIVLNALGVVDFGINNVVGGVVTMLAFFTSALTNSTQRYLNIELGRNNIEAAGRVFRSSLLIYIALAFIVFIAAEAIGLWLLHYKLIIPADRMDAASWVLQASIASFCITIIGATFNAAIIARENMKMFAYVGLAEALMRLSIAFAILYAPVDKLKLYAVLFALSSIIVQLSYAAISLSKYPECRLRLLWDKSLVRGLSGFIGWNTFSAAVWVVNEQGINILLNFFFGPVVNAAKAIASQVSGAINGFSVNFFTAIKPQIITSYAADELDYFRQLVFDSNRYSFYLLWTLCLPLLLRMDYVLHLWLGNPPDAATAFCLWTLIHCLVYVFENPFWTATQAIGKLRRYCMIGSSVYLMAFPVSYVLLKLGFPAISVFQVVVLFRIAFIVTVILIVNSYFPLHLGAYARQVLQPIVLVLVTSLAASYVVSEVLPDNFGGFAATLLSCIVLSGICSYALGITKAERDKVNKFIEKHIFHKS